MTSSAQLQGYPAKLVYLSDTPFVESEVRKYLVLKQFLPKTTQIEINRIMNGERLAYYIEMPKKTILYISKLWMERVKKEGVSQILFEEENEKKEGAEKSYRRYKHEFSIEEMNKQLKEEFKYFGEEGGALV